MKQIRSIILVLFLALFVTACSTGNKNHLVSLSYKEFNEKLENKDTFFVEVVQDGCSHCANFTPKLKSVLEDYDVVGYQLNLTDISDEDYSKFYSKFGISSTPTIFFVTNGEETSILERVVGNVSDDKVISKLQANGYIK